MASHEQFLRLFLQHQGDVRAFIGSLVRDANAREDLFQEVAMICWRDFARYDPARSFGAWARGIAANKVKQWWERSSRGPAVFSPQTVAALLDAFNRTEHDDAAPRLDALRECLRELPEKARRLLAQRYQLLRKPAEIAAHLKTTRDAVYKALARTRIRLRDCIRRRLALRGRGA